MTQPATKQDGGKLPSHVAIIMDGNGRWAKARGLPRTAGHKRGADAVKEAMEGCSDLNIPYLTIYAFSSENWQRSPDEVGDLMELLRLYLKRELQVLHKRGVSLKVIGDRTRLPADIRKLVEEAEALTRNNRSLYLSIALSYGSRQELIQAVRTLAQQVKEGGIEPQAIDEALFSSALYTNGTPDPDLLIRTGGEQRLSNFLLWQSAYTELFFTDILWPDFTREHLKEAAEEFSRRERRYGTA